MNDISQRIGPKAFFSLSLSLYILYLRLEEKEKKMVVGGRSQAYNILRPSIYLFRHCVPYFCSAAHIDPCIYIITIGQKKLLVSESVYIW